MNNQYESARKAGYSDDEILDYFSKKDPEFGQKINSAKSQGYQPQDILTHLTKKQSQQYPESAYPSDEDVQRDIERSQSQLLSRTGEALLGAPGDIASFISGLFGSEQNVLPTSQKLRQATKKATLGYTEPKTEFEETVGDVYSDIGSMLIPGSGHYSFARNLGIPVVGGLVKEGLRYANADEKKQSYAKVGTMVALDLLSRRTGGTKKFVDSLFEKARQALPEDAVVDASNLSKTLNRVEKELTAGGSRPSAKKALEKVQELKNEIVDGKIEASRLEAYRPSINEAIEELGGFNLEISRKLRPQAIRNLNTVKDSVISSLYEYGEKFNPEYLKYSKEANEAFAAIKKSNKIANFIENKINYAPKSDAGRMLFALGTHGAVLGGAKLFGPLSAGAGGLGLVGYNALKVLSRVKNSPTLRKYYQNVIKNAAAGNVTQTTKNLKALDQQLLKDQD